jgi:Kef-type K+ transport system membrane component KefB
MDGTALAEGIRDFFGPLFFALVGIIGVLQLLKVQLVRFFQLVLLAILVSILLYQPGVIRGFGNQIAELLPSRGYYDHNDYNKD